MLFFLWWNTARRSCRTFILQLQIIKNLLVKVRRLRSEPKAGKKSRWSTIFHELKSVVKTKIAQNNSQVSEGGVTVKPGQDSSSIHELIIWKENPFVPSVTCSRYQIAFKWSVNVWLLLFSIRWDGKYFNGWNFYLDILQIQENWAVRNFITNSCVYSLLITQAKMQSEINN